VSGEEEVKELGFLIINSKIILKKKREFDGPLVMA